jgi:hypothetical protein
MNNARSHHQDSPRLCQRCKRLDLWRSQHAFSYTPAYLEEHVKNCLMCSIFHRGIQNQALPKYDAVQFSTVGSSIACSALKDRPIASLYTIREYKGVLPHMQRSRPILARPGSAFNSKTISAWIHSCDQNHACQPKSETLLPTRVLDVGENQSNSLRLVSLTRGHRISGKYLALSHRWGSPTIHKMFQTLTSNLETFKEGIEVRSLPRTFRQAVEITRSLRVQYLWIDSLCIVQDDPEDWDHESKLMEQVFSSAYITIAATCSNGTNDGFLKERPERICIKMIKGDAFYFVCEAIDNFVIDVEQAELNKRGWVLQERALSRRTIHFTDKQCYWECGGGVRCETLTKMKKYL